MKYIYFLIMFFFLFLIGCSSTYKITDFPSKDQFFADFNKSAKDNSLKVFLKDDSTITSNDGARISNDSLLLPIQVQKVERISKDKINDIKYSGSDMSNLSAIIFLKNGTEAIAKNVNILSDSSITATILVNNEEYIPINKVKEISYKNHWVGVPGKLILSTGLGAGFGAFVGFIISKINPPNNSLPGSGSYAGGIDAQDVRTGLIVGSVIGFITGGIIGWISGYTYTYQFNP
ncbi:MAG: hypothetical protein ACYDA4_12085 [Ignavibacteriaceae bacterium]